MSEEHQIRFYQKSLSSQVKSKSYLKITRLSYKLEQDVLTPEIVEDVLKKSHLFEDIILVSRPHVIKVSPKSDSVVVWIDIWNL